jgi:hypothetical protein
MTRDQKTVGIGAASGVVAMIISIAGIYELWPINPGLADISRRLAFALQANAFAALPLLIGVLTVGNNRFLSEAIDPTLQKEDLATQINGRVVENTLQQFALFLVAITALSVNLTADTMRIRYGSDRIPQRGTSGVRAVESTSRLINDRIFDAGEFARRRGRTFPALRPSPR